MVAAVYEEHVYNWWQPHELFLYMVMIPWTFPALQSLCIKENIVLNAITLCDTLLLKKIIVIQLQLYSFSPPPSTTSTLPFGSVHVSA